MTIVVSLGRESTTIEREVFAALFEESVLSDAAGYRNAMRDGRITFSSLVEIARKADIPYSLFFAPLAHVEQQLKRKTDILIGGVGKDAFSMNSRGSVRLADVELVIKDILRKQTLLKEKEGPAAPNPIVEMIKKSERPIAQDALAIRTALGIDLSRLRAARTKTAAFELLVDMIEAHNIFVSQSAKNYMPQQIPKRARFSGMSVKDKRMPFIFLNNRDEEESYEPVGRRILTLVLLVVCIARGEFRAVTYNDMTGDLIASTEYELAEEVLMPAAEFAGISVESLAQVKEQAATFQVTPSAIIMRARRLALITQDDAKAYLAELKREYANASKTPMRQPKPETALRKYNGAEFSRRLLAQMDRGRLPQSEVVRVLFLNRLTAAKINDYRAVL